MLDMMRRHAQSWFIKVLLGGIVVTFISWGGYSRYQERSNTVAYINGKALTVQEYERAYAQTMDMYRSQLGGLDEATLKALNLRGRVYDQMVERTLILQEAARLGLSVSEDELRQSILQFPAFQVDGRFDDNRYQKLLALNHLTPTQFEDEQRAAATIDKLRRLVTGFAKVSEAEAFEQWRQSSEKVAVDYAAFPSADYVSKVAISDSDLQAYYNARKEGFRKPPQLKLGYVVFKLEDFARQAAPSEAKLREEYNLFQDDYRSPKQVKARHILLSLPAGANKDKDQERQVEQKALGVLAEAKAGKDFSELAKKYSQDAGSAAKGGDLGWFGHGQMVKEFEEAAFSLSRGAIGGPVKSKFGYHIIKVEDVREARLKPFEEVRDQIAAKLTIDKAQELAASRLGESYGQVAKAGGLKKWAQSQGLAYVQTDFVSAADQVPGLLDSARVVQKAFTKKAGEIESDPERKSGPVLFEVTERRDAYVPPLAEVAKVVRERMASEKAQELAGTAAASLLAEVRTGMSFAAAAAKLKVKVKHVEPFARSANNPELGPEATKAAFKLTAAQPAPTVPYRNATGFVAMKLTQRLEPSPEEFSAQKAQMLQRLLSYKRQQIFDQWLKRVREKADIEVVNKIS
jgi:peptidyl-prolyl cis-trans isomerase D